MTARAKRLDPRSGLLWLALLLAMPIAIAASPDAAGPGTEAAGPGPDDAGRVIIAVGDVTATAAPAPPRPVARGDRFGTGDTLRTGPRGRAQLRFDDDARLSLRPDSELAVREFVHEPAAPPARQRTSLALTRGGFRTVTGEIADRHREGYRVTTPFAVLGVRGTDFVAVIADLGDGRKLYVGVREGRIFARNDGGRIDLGDDAQYSYAVIDDFDTPPRGLVAPPTVVVELFEAPFEDGPGGDPGSSGGGAGGSGGAGGTPVSASAGGASGESEDEALVYELSRRCL